MSDYATLGLARSATREVRTPHVPAITMKERMLTLANLNVFGGCQEARLAVAQRLTLGTSGAANQTGVPRRGEEVPPRPAQQRV